MDWTLYVPVALWYPRSPAFYPVITLDLIVLDLKTGSSEEPLIKIHDKGEKNGYLALSVVQFTTVQSLAAET